MATYELTPQQWAALMGRLGPGYGAYDDLVAHIGQGYSFSQTYIVSGRNESEIASRGFGAVSRGGEGALATVEVRYPRGSQRPGSYAVTTADSRIQQEIAGLGVQAAPDRREEAFRIMYALISEAMREPQVRMDEFRRLLEGVPRREILAMPPQRQEQARPNEGRDRILGNVGRAFSGTTFSVATPEALGYSEEYDRRQRERDSIPLGRPGPVEPNEERFHLRGGGTGFMRYVEPGGGSSVYAGDRRLYTDYPITERNAFAPGLGRSVGTLRIYGSPDRPDRFEVITDSPALRSAMERAGIPVRPATEQQPQLPNRQRPGT